MYPSEGGIVERPTTEQSHGELARNFGSRQTRSTHGHRGANISAQEPRDSRPGGRWAHPPSTGGDLTNSRVRSTHPFHTKSPFSRFGGGRRQKSENIVVSARGRRRPQAPTLRTLGCAIARKYDYKSSSLYAQSSGPRPLLECHLRTLPFLTFDPVFQVLLCGCSESSRLAQRHPKVFIRYIDVGHGGCDSLARFSGKKFVPRVQYATHFSARRSVEHALLLTY